MSETNQINVNFLISNWIDDRSETKFCDLSVNDAQNVFNELKSKKPDENSCVQNFDLLMNQCTHISGNSKEINSRDTVLKIAGHKVGSKMICEKTEKTFDPRVCHRNMVNGLCECSNFRSTIAMTLYPNLYQKTK